MRFAELKMGVGNEVFIGCSCLLMFRSKLQPQSDNIMSPF
jgi:hypothetical protein